MNIAIIRHSIRNRGSDHALFDYANYLIKKDHQIFYYTNEIRTDIKWNPAIVMKKIPIKGKLGTVIFTLITKFSEDVVALDLIALSCLVWTRNKQKLIYLARGFDVSYYSSPVMRGLIYFLYTLGLRLLKIKCICASEPLAKNLAVFHPTNLVTVTNGVDTNFFSKNPTSSFTKQSNEKVILLYTRDEYVKGLDIAQKAINSLFERNKDNWVLWTIGQDTKIKVDCKVVHYGFLDKEKLRDVLSVADIFLLPSRSEGLSPLLLQALACGCAVVATQAAHIISDGKNGLISDLEDWKDLTTNLDRLLRDPKLLDQLKQNGRMLAEQYTLQKSCAEFEKAICDFSTIARR